MWINSCRAVSLLILIAIAGCGQVEPESQSGTALTVQTLPAQIERSHIEIGTYQEWHDARTNPSPGITVVPLESGIANARIFIEVLDTLGNPVSASLRDEAGKVIEEISTEGTGVWSDLLFAATARMPSEIHLETSGPLSVGRIDYITNAPVAESDIIIVLIDTLRADHVGAYGYPRNTTPNIDKLAEDGILFTQFISQTSWTRTAIASLLTSTYPNIHGALDRGDVVRDSVDWLPDTLQDAGYDTQGIMTNPNGLPIWGFGKGFRRYVDSDSQDWFSSDDADAIRRSIEFLSSPSTSPRFHYLHLLAPHSPYLAREPFKSQLHRPRHATQNDTEFERQNTIDLYDAEIAYVDSELGKFFAHLKQEGKYDSSLIVVVSDHGEEFWEHGGTSHGKTLYDEQLKVPFIVKLPGNEAAGTRYTHIVECVDVAPSLLEYAGVDSPAGFQGTSFISAVKANTAYKKLAYTSLRLDQASMEATQSVEDKLIYDLATQKKEWFELDVDPDEQFPLAQSPLDPDPLMRHIQTMSRDGAEGLHILMTHDSKSSIRFSGTISGINGFELSYPDELTTATLADDTLAFSIEMPEADNPFLPSSKWRKGLADPTMQKILLIDKPEAFMTEMDFAEIIIPAGFEDRLTLNFQLDDQPVPQDQVNLGGIGQHGSVEGLEGTALEWIAPPFAISLESLPRATNLYIWHVPPAASIADEDLDPELEEALRGLGYLE